MGITSRKVPVNDPLAVECIFIPVVTLTAASTEVQAKFTPGYAFQITKVASYCKSNTNVTLQVKVGATSVLATGAAVTPVALTETSHALHATLANRRGVAASQVSVEAISGATPALPTGGVFLEVRPYPMDGESYQGA